MKIFETKAVDSRQGILPTKSRLYYETVLHITNVYQLYLQAFLDSCKDVETHDWTKLEYIDKFHLAMKHFLEEGKGFKSSWWWNLHVKQEKHHFLDYTGKDPITLFDIIHGLCDWIAAGIARHGEVKVDYDKSINQVLFMAFENTIELLKKKVTLLKVIEDDGSE